MARNSDGTSGNGLQVSAGSLLGGSNGPWAILFWFKSNSTLQSTKYISAFSTGANQISVIYEYVANRIEMFTTGHTGTAPRTGSQITIGDTLWHHIAYRKAASGTAEYAYFLDGVKTVINASATTTFPATGTPNTVLLNSAAMAASTPDAQLAEYAVYEGTVPTDEQIAAMAKGLSPAFFPNGLQSYWKLSGDGTSEPDHFGGLTLASTGTTKTAHPLTIYRGDVFKTSDVAAQSSYTYTGSGGFTLSGQASTEVPIFCPCNTITETAAGGLQWGGTATTNVIHYSSGGFTWGGQAITDMPDQIAYETVFIMPLDESTGATYEDEAQDLDGTQAISSAIPTPGNGVGCTTCQTFNGRQWITIPEDTLTASLAFTFTAFAQIDSKYKERCFFSRGTNAGYSCRLGHDVLNRLHFHYRDGTNEFDTYAETVLQPSYWYSIAVEVRPSQDVTFYIDGQPDGTSEITTSPIETNNGGQLARWNTYGHLEGSLQEARLYEGTRGKAYLKAYHDMMCRNNFVTLGDIEDPAWGID